MTYREYTEKKQEEFNKIPLFWAFSDKQFEEQLAKRGITVQEAPERVYRMKSCGGAFYLKEDAEIVREYFCRDDDKELRDMMEADPEFCMDAFTYEMYNHEYPINWQGDWDVCSVFGKCVFSEAKYGYDYLKELGFSDKVIGIYEQARRKVQKSMDW